MVAPSRVDRDLSVRESLPRASDPASIVRLVEAARAGSIRAAGRLMSWLEEDPTRLTAWCAELGNWPMPRLLVGVTGSPGTGKSTLVDALVRLCRTRRPLARIGVLAVDPSSPFSGGALLGDRVRMMAHATDPMVFIRSLASRGHLGGLALAASGIARVLGLLGCDSVFIETVGIGQSEMEVTHLADMTVLVLAPGQGDGVQMLKAGLMEAADVFVVTKADRPGADRVVSDLLSTLELSGNSRAADVVKVSSLERFGLDELMDVLEAYAIREAARVAQRRALLLEAEVRTALLEEARRRIERVLDANGQARGGIADVLDGRASVSEAVARAMRLALEE